jgi:hypothetical protein
MPRPDSAEFEKLYKVRPLLDRIREKSQAAYQPHQEVAVDEAMILFKGRSAMRQYMPKKPVKWGYKCWCICDARNGYMYNLDIYTREPVVPLTRQALEPHLSSLWWSHCTGSTIMCTWTTFFPALYSPTN